MTPDPISNKGLCESCKYRAESIKAAHKFIVRGGLQDPNSIVCDPAPKAECKHHRWYGYHEDESKSFCRDYFSVTPKADAR